MKKLKVLIPIAILLILVILIGLSFLRLPMNILSQEMVERETKGFVTLNSLSNQTLKIELFFLIEFSFFIFVFKLKSDSKN